MKQLFKMVIGILLVVTVFSACGSELFGASSKVNTTTENIKTIQKAATDGGVNFKKQTVYVPSVLTEAKDLSPLKIYLTKDKTVRLEYDFTGQTEDEQNESNLVKGYDIEKIVVAHLSEDQIDKLETEFKDFYTEYKTNGKSFFIYGEYESKTLMYNITMVYMIEDSTGIYVNAKLPNTKKMTDKIAEKFYEDFQCVKLTSLGK